MSPNPDYLFDEQMDDDVKTVKVPFERERKKSRHLCHPYTAPPPTTPKRTKKCRTKAKISKSRMQSLIGEDGNDIILEPWVEVYVRFCIFFTLYI